MAIRAPAPTHRSILTLRPVRILSDIVIFVLASAVLAAFMWMVLAS